MALSLTDLNDVVKMTRSNYRENKITDLSQNLVNYKLATFFFHEKPSTDGHGDVTFDPTVIPSGLNHTFDLRVNQTGYAFPIGPWGTFTSTAQDGVIQGTTQQRFGGWAFRVDDFEKGANEGAEQIVDLIQSRFAASEKDVVRLVDSMLAVCPPSSDKIRLQGLPYHLVKNSSRGFNGGNPTGSDGVAYSSWNGIDRSTVANTKNYTDTFAAVSKPDFVAKLVNIDLQVSFESPINNPIDARDYDCVRFTTMKNWRQLKPIVEQQNVQIGDNLYHFKAILFGGAPIVPVATFDSTDGTDNPIYCVNRKGLYPIHFRTKNIINTPEVVQIPNTFGKEVRGAWGGNLEMTDIKSQAVMYYDASATALD